MRKLAPISFGASMVIAPRYRRVFIDGKALDLTRREFDYYTFWPGILAKCLQKSSFIGRFGMITMIGRSGRISKL